MKFTRNSLGARATRRNAAALAVAAATSLLGIGRADRPLDFNIHFRDGLRIRYPVDLKGLTADNGWFAPEQDQFYCLMWFNQSLDATSLSYRVRGP